MEPVQSEDTQKEDDLTASEEKALHKIGQILNDDSLNPSKKLGAIQAVAVNQFEEFKDDLILPEEYKD